jgi:SPW repeat
LLVSNRSAYLVCVKERQVTVVTVRWQEWASFVLGLWLAVSPWTLGYDELHAATANAAFLGIALALGSHFEASIDECSAEWLNLAAGLWLVLAPFFLGFSAATLPTANSVAVGTLVMVLAGSALSLDKEIGKWWDKLVAGH